MSHLTHLECSRCGKTYDADRPQNLCPACRRPLLARYDLDTVRRTLSRDDLETRPADLWRYRELLPVRDPRYVLTLVDGVITDCGRAAAKDTAEFDRFDMSTLKEPYRLEGKKTMGYELAEQMNWVLPDVIVYPTGGGTGLVGVWKAFDEMEKLGWIDSRRPRMVAVQPEGCAPIVRAFERNSEFADPWENAKTIADGLRVPAAVGDFLMLRVTRESRGTALAVSDGSMLDGANLIGRTQGMFVSPESGATLAAFVKLREAGWILDGEKVVLFHTGSGAKYAHLWGQKSLERP